jgi:hypothetical protein
MFLNTKFAMPQKFLVKYSCLQVFLHLLGDPAGGHLSVQGVCSHHILKARRFRLITEAKNGKVKENVTLI